MRERQAWGAGYSQERAPGFTPEPHLLLPQGLVCVSSKLRLAERRQQRLQEVQAKRDHLCEELAETQGRLMVEPGRWLEQCECPRPSVTKPRGLAPCPGSLICHVPSLPPVSTFQLLSFERWWIGRSPGVLAFLGLRGAWLPPGPCPDPVLSLPS